MKQTEETMEEKKFDTMEVLAVAVAAYELNNYKYLKNNVIEAKNNEPMCPHYIKYFANKEIIKYYFLPIQYKNIETRPPRPQICDNHKKIAEEVKKYVGRIVFKILGKKQKSSDDTFFDIGRASYDGYLENLYKIINQEKVTEYEFGLIASALTYYYNEKEKEIERDKMADLKNCHVGTIGNKIYLDDFEVLKIIPSKKFGGFIVKGIANNNLFLYYSSKPVNFRVGETLKISGKIKKHETDTNTNNCVTCLNYVDYN